MGDERQTFLDLINQNMGRTVTDWIAVRAADLVKENPATGEVTAPILDAVKMGVSSTEVFFKGAFQSVVDSFTNRISPMISDALASARKWFVDTLVESEKEWTAASVRDGILSKEAEQTILNLIGTNPVIGLVASKFIWLTNNLVYFGHMFKASQSASLQTINVKYRPNLPELGMILRACFTSPGDTGAVRDIATRLGYRDEDIDLMFKASYATYTSDEAFRLWLRGDLNDAQLVARLRENGLTDDRIQELRHLYDIIPPISDLLMMLAKEAFEEDQVRKFGLDDEYPVEVEEYAKKQGLNPPWPKRYWRAHWNHASPGQVLEMLHRGIVTDEDVYEYYRVVEIPPYWRDKLVKINYSPYARVDTRRMYELGVISAEEVYRNYRWEGYDHEHATKLTQFAIKLKQASGKELTVSEVLKGYRLGFLDRASVMEFLQSVGFSKSEAEYKIEYEDYSQSLKDREERIGIIGDRFKANLITEATARDLLNELLDDSQKIDTYIAKWSVAYEKSIRRPTKGDLDKMLSYATITVDQYVYEMSNLGYSDKHIGMFLELLAAENGVDLNA